MVKASNGDQQEDNSVYKSTIKVNFSTIIIHKFQYTIEIMMV